MTRRLEDLAVWRMPVMLAVSSIFGLISALLGDGFWDVLSWVSLGWPVAIMIWFGVMRPRFQTKSLSSTRAAFVQPPSRSRAR